MCRPCSEQGGLPAVGPVLPRGPAGPPAVLSRASGCRLSPNLTGCDVGKTHLGESTGGQLGRLLTFGGYVGQWVGERRAQSRLPEGLRADPPPRPVRHRTRTGLRSVRPPLPSLGREVRLCLAAAVGQVGGCPLRGLSGGALVSLKGSKVQLYFRDQGEPGLYGNALPVSPGCTVVSPTAESDRAWGAAFAYLCVDTCPGGSREGSRWVVTLFGVESDGTTTGCPGNPHCDGRQFLPR